MSKHTSGPWHRNGTEIQQGAHTPGPWTVVRRRDGAAISPIGLVSLGDHDERQAANLQLVAAAPELADFAAWAIDALADGTQTRNAAENIYCPWCQQDEDRFKDMEEHRPDCEFVKRTDAAKALLKKAGLLWHP